MKLDVKLPGGVEVHFEKEPIGWDRFCAICVLIGIYMVGSGFLKFLLIIKG